MHTVSAICPWAAVLLDNSYAIEINIQGASDRPQFVSHAHALEL